MRYIWPIIFIATIFGANWSLATFGVVAIGFGLMAPAGVYFAGLTFTCRDMVHDMLGRRWVVALILLGASLSWWLEPRFAIASGAAFLASEALDYAVYAPMRARGWLKAVALSNTFGLVADSLLFLWLAFGSLDFVLGLLVGKAYMTAAAIIILWMAKYVLSHRRLQSQRHFHRP